MAKIIPFSDAVKKQLTLNERENSLNYFLNEQIRDAVEALEGKPQDDVVISASGHIKQYLDGTREFYWKEKRVLVVGLRKINEEQLEIYADHMYDDFFSTTLEEFNND